MDELVSGSCISSKHVDVIGAVIFSCASYILTLQVAYAFQNRQRAARFRYL